jgi:hypothetical protein
MVLGKLWTEDEVKVLKEMCEQGKSVEEIAEHLDRSLDAIKLKLHRLGLVVSGETLVSSTTSTTTGSTTASTTTLEPIKPAEQLISVEEAAKMTLGCIQRLNEKGLTGLDIKRIRLIIPALKSYIILQTDYIEKLAKVERHIEELNRVVLAQLEDKVAKAQTDQERKLWEEQLLSLKEKM